MNTDLRKKAKNDFEIFFLKLMNNCYNRKKKELFGIRTKL